MIPVGHAVDSEQAERVVGQELRRRQWTEAMLGEVPATDEPTPL